MGSQDNIDYNLIHGIRKDEIYNECWASVNNILLIYITSTK